MFPNAFGFDPSKMDPKTLMELSVLVRELPPEQLSRMQTLMHNMMGGFNVQKEMEEFERTLPAGFRDKLMGIMLRGGANSPVAPASVEPSRSTIEEAQVVSVGPQLTPEMSVRDARLTVLRAVADGSMDPEDALIALWPSP